MELTFDDLIAKNAGCIEMAFYGFIRLYEEGEKRCECKDCLSFKQEQSQS